MASQFIVGYNGNVGGRDALALALAFADTSCAQRAAITVASIFPMEQYARTARIAPASRAQAMADEADGRLDGAREVCRGRDDVTFVARAGRSPAHGLQLLADELTADMIVVGRSHTGPLGRAFVGSATEQTLHGAETAVAVAPVGYADAEHRIATVAVAYSGSDESENALSFAIRVARDRGAMLRLVQVIEPIPMAYGGMVNPYPASARRDDVAEGLDAAAERIVGVNVETSILDGDAVGALSDLGSTADLLVVGSRDYGPIGRVLLGGVSSRLSRHCPTPLLVIPRGLDASVTPAPPVATGAEVASTS